VPQLHPPGGGRRPLVVARARHGAQPWAVKSLLLQAQADAAASDATTTAEEIESMRAGAIKQELESYGISTVAFLEKKELVQALKQARADGLQPKQTTTKPEPKATATNETSTSSADSATTTPSSTDTPLDTRPRKERLQEELERCRALKAGELKKELASLGISTRSLFEKTELVQALATARVDGVVAKQQQPAAASTDESYAEYANVEVITDHSTGPRQKQPEKQQQKQQQPAGGGNPFDDMMGGMGGGMGGIADMLKNMGGMGGGAAAAGGGNPFGGMGGMGGMGDAMGKVQELMKNPKVREIMQKAQSNPKIMQAVTETMSNPAAFAKYQNDPEVAEIINELRKYM